MSTEETVKWMRWLDKTILKPFECGIVWSSSGEFAICERPEDVYGCPAWFEKNVLVSKCPDEKIGTLKAKCFLESIIEDLNNGGIYVYSYGDWARIDLPEACSFEELKMKIDLGWKISLGKAGSFGWDGKFLWKKQVLSGN